MVLEPGPAPEGAAVGLVMEAGRAPAAVALATEEAESGAVEAGALPPWQGGAGGAGGAAAFASRALTETGGALVTTSSDSNLGMAGAGGATGTGTGGTARLRVGASGSAHGSSIPACASAAVGTRAGAAGGVGDRGTAGGGGTVTTS